MGFLDSCSGASGKDTRFLLGKSEDLFRDLPSPRTGHCEALVLLERLDG